MHKPLLLTDLDGLDDTAPAAFSFNKDFARKYEEKKRTEELSKLQQTYGDDGSDYESSSSEEEDEIGELATPDIDAGIMQTLSAIRTRDPAIYDPKQDFFSDEQVAEARKMWSEKQKERKGAKPLTIKDYHRKRLVESGGMESGDENEPQVLTHVEEQSRLKDEFKKALLEAEIGDGDAEQDMGGFARRQKSEQEQDAEDDQYRKFLLESLALKENTKEEFQRWKTYKENPGIDADDKFLMDFIMNRGWIDKDMGRIPDHKDLVDDTILDELSGDAEQLDMADEFEHVYNFRFEEPGGFDVLGHARDIPTSMRRKDDRRKLARETRAERKKAESERKREEVKRLKNLKKQAISDKLNVIKGITGHVSKKVEQIDVDGDFDPERHDREMAAAFDAEYYEDSAANIKPVFEDDIDISDILPSTTSMPPEKDRAKKKRKRRDAEEDDDGELDMDADFINVESVDEQIAQAKIDLAKQIQAYQKLDYEDTIGDIRTRFPYHKVVPSTYGLDLVDILEADDSDLRQFISLKKLAPFRPVEKQALDERKVSKSRRVREFRAMLQEKQRLEQQEVVRNRPSKSKSRKK